MATSCAQCREQLSEILEIERREARGLGTPDFGGVADSQVQTESLQDLRAHLENCADCRRELARMRAMQQSVATLPTLAAPDDLRARIRAQIEGESQKATVVVPADVPTKADAKPLQVLAENKSSARVDWRERLASWWRPNQLAWAGGGMALAAFCVLMVSQNPPQKSTVRSESAPTTDSAISQGQSTPPNAAAPSSASRSRTLGKAAPNEAARAGKDPARPSLTPPQNFAPAPAAPQNPPTNAETSVPNANTRFAAPPSSTAARPNTAQRSDSTASPPRAASTNAGATAAPATVSPSQAPIAAKGAATLAAPNHNAARIAIRVGPVNAPSVALPAPSDPSPSTPTDSTPQRDNLAPPPRVEGRTVFREGEAGGFGGNLDASESRPSSPGAPSANATTADAASGSNAAAGLGGASTARRAAPVAPKALGSAKNRGARNDAQAEAVAPATAPDRSAPVVEAPSIASMGENASKTADRDATQAAPESLRLSNPRLKAQVQTNDDAGVAATRQITVEVVPTRDIARASVRAQVKAPWRIVTSGIDAREREIWRGQAVSGRPIRLQLQLRAPQNQPHTSFGAPAALSIELFDLAPKARRVARQSVQVPAHQR